MDAYKFFVILKHCF